MQGSATDFICLQQTPAIEMLSIYNHVSEWILSLPEECLFNYLAGLIDGDGSWNPNRQILNIFTVN